MNNDIKNISNREIKQLNGDGDDDKIIFNVKRLFEEAIKGYNESELYDWAKLEGYLPEPNGDIRIDETMRLTRKF